MLQTASNLAISRLAGLLTLALTLPACAINATPESNAMMQNPLPQVAHGGLRLVSSLRPLRARGDASKVERVLHSFTGGKDGSDPEPELTAVGSTLYGATHEGGDSACSIVVYGSVGCGTIFKIDTSGSGYSVLYRFKTANSGTFPTLGVIDVNNMLFGTAFYSGGDGSKCDSAYDGCGTLYEVSPTGKGFKVLHDFVGGSDGAGPYANLASGGSGTLYGATNGGGFNGSSCGSQGGCGTVYAFDLTSGTESVVYPFRGGTDGIDPISVADIKGLLFGVTFYGGSSSICPAGPSLPGCGTIYKIDPTSGTESVVYRFKGGKDGAFPTNVLSVNGDLYGTAEEGGGPACAGSGYTGCGIVFKVSATSGIEKVLYRFKGGTDGISPVQLLADSKGTLYGTTYAGGGSGCGGSGCGTIFKIDTSGKGYAVVYRFLGGTDGAFPLDGVVAVDGKLYGTTWEGGGSGCGGSGCGTIFEATP